MQRLAAVLREDVCRQIGEIGEADVLVGIPSFNNARTIGHVVRAAQAGLGKYFSSCRAVLVNSDGGSTDETLDVVRQASVDFGAVLVQNQVQPLHKILTPYVGLPGKGSAFRTIFEIARALKVKACAVVDSDLRSITPEWFELLLRPVLQSGFDYVAPYYHRHKFDGTITNTIVYPMTRALFGKQIRQPIGGDFGFSGRLSEFYANQDVWESDVARYGIDIWMTGTAVANGFRVCQAFLGAKIHDPKDPGSDLSAMLHQVVGALFSLMETYRSSWESVVGSMPVPTFGFVYAVGLEPVSVNLAGMLDKMRMGVRELRDVYCQIVSPESMADLVAAADLNDERFALPDETWVRLIYDFAVACHRRTMNREHLIKSLTPLYLGKVASFVIECRDSDAVAVEQRLEALCQAFERNKPYLVSRWEIPR
ncbi:MAG TPA: glycosyl transferase family 2 [Acidobacteriota bacterium]|nr:glycosyl transferase family 2 [Acidobacteriota bacterium]